MTGPSVPSVPSTKSTAISPTKPVLKSVAQLVHDFKNSPAVVAKSKVVSSQSVVSKPITFAGQKTDDEKNTILNGLFSVVGGYVDSKHKGEVLAGWRHVLKF